MVHTRTYTHTHTYTAAGDISLNPKWPWIETMQLRCTTPHLDCVCVSSCFVFLLGVSHIVLSVLVLQGIVDV